MSNAFQIDWDNLGCQIIPTKTMYISKKIGTQAWSEGEFKAFGKIELSPAAQVLNYGQGIFEGLKAQRTKSGSVVLFRHEDNARRFLQSALSMSMPPFPEKKFLSVIEEIVKENINYVPPYKKGVLYIRPCMWGTDEILNVTPANEYTFLTYTTPVGYYLGKGITPIKLDICDTHHRAAPKGMGSTKTIGNYPGAMRFAEQARTNGYKGCLYLDAIENRYIEEAEAANFFCVKDNVLYTPALGTIMPGITRDSVIQITKNILNIPVVEKSISIDEALSADECFCTGTLASIVSVGLLNYKNRQVIFNNFEVGDITKKIMEILIGIQLCEIENQFSWIHTLE